MDKERKENIGIVGQWVTGVLVGVGIGIEVTMGAEIGYIFITSGSALFAAFTKVRKI